MAKRVDRNQTLIVDALRSVGASVQVLSDVGKGCPDLLVGFRRVNYLMEVKDGEAPPSKQKLTEDELKWHYAWRGQKAVVHSVDEALEVIGLRFSALRGGTYRTLLEENQ